MKSMKIKRLGIVALLMVTMMTLHACDEGLTDINEDPTVATELSPEFKITRAQLQASEGRFEAWRGNLIYASNMIQHLASTTTAWAGDRYTINNDYLAAHWGTHYPNSVKTIEDLIAQVQDEPDWINLYAQARILRVFIYHRITDLYGDIPYSEAGKGFIEGNTSPVYDPQEEIYTDMIDELTQAVSDLSENQGMMTFGENDLFYEGDVTQWIKFGNSLKMRLGMRLTEVDESLAQSVVEEAAADMYMEDTDDTAWINHESGPSGINRNGVGEAFQDFGLEGHNFRLSNTLVDLMKDEENSNQNVDPRLTIFANVYDEDGNSTTDDPLDYQGLENGLDAADLGDLELLDFAMPNRELMTSYSSPNLFMTHAETRFILAEAAARGWNVPGDAQTHYEEGIRSAMEHLAFYGEDGEISEDDIQAYIDGVPPADIEQINTQKWIALYLNGFEAYANWRRTGYPELDPVDFPGNRSGGEIPRRYLYPVPEQQNNSTNYDEAINRQGEDEFMTRMWWDAE
ncbi:MAG: SusD/RagB family nutrient-binding outer membrane lipoprotein [Bacteroidota bacterium]